MNSAPTLGQKVTSVLIAIGTITFLAIAAYFFLLTVWQVVTVYHLVTL